MMFSARQAEIMALAKEQGRVLVDELAARFAVTPQTIRKDLNDLCDARALTRIHGGAVYPSGNENVKYEARRSMAATEKQAIGRAAADLIPHLTSGGRCGEPEERWSLMRDRVEHSVAFAAGLALIRSITFCRLSRASVRNWC